MRKVIPRQHVAQAMNGFGIAVEIRERHECLSNYMH